MTIFLIVGVLLMLGALLYVLRPLLRGARSAPVSRDAVNVALYQGQLRELETDLRSGTLAQDAYETARRELEQRLLEDVKGGEAARSSSSAGLPGALALGVAVPICALAVYVLVGTPAALDPQVGNADSASHAMNPERLAQAVEAFAARLKENPDNPSGWAMLARSYGAMRRYEDATAAYAEAAKQNPNDAQLFADYADTLAMARDRKLEGEPEELIERALKIDPNNVKALALAGTVAFERDDFAGAVKHWERVIAVAPDSPFGQSIRESIAEARSRLNGSGDAKGVASTKQPPSAVAKASAVPGTTGSATSAPPAAGSGRISGIAKLAPELAKKVAPEDSVFIFARAAEGPRMPLAIVRKQARDLPLSFVLDDSMAMNPQMKLSSVKDVIVTARVSKAADATTRPGDLQGESRPVKMGAQVEVVIDTVVR